jgi:alpha-L-rhamnosidase
MTTMVEKCAIPSWGREGKRRALVCLFAASALFCSAPLRGQEQLGADLIRPDLFNRYWQARWITHPDGSLYDWGIYHFRRVFRLESPPQRLIAHLSGDNRYRLYVNGTYICNGPARDELEHWRYESVDLAPFLKKGENVIAALIWNFGEHRPVFQQTFATAFLLQANDTAFHFLNTGQAGWKAFNNEAYAPETAGIDSWRTYHVVGPGERFDAARYPWGWETLGYDDERWPAARRLSEAHPAAAGSGHGWGLTPRAIPMMEERPVRLARVRRVEGPTTVPPAFSRGEGLLIIPANSRASFLFDQGELTNAHPVLAFSEGRGANIRLTYAESLYEPRGNNNKGHRDLVEGKIMKGQQDLLLCDGGSNRVYSPLWFRTYRYLRLEVETGEQPLRIHDLYGRYNGYPFRQRAQFDAEGDASLADIWTASWRTALLCAGETYYDCPYYEQLQYVGDTRIQALISLYVDGDDRLMRQAIDAFDHSRLSNGLTQSRYPAARPLQIIPPYSLLWISMVYDYWRHRDDTAYVASKLMGVRNVLEWFEGQVRAEDGLIWTPPHWNFVDWSLPRDPQSRLSGVPPMQGSSILTLAYVYALQHAAELCRAFGDAYHAGRYERRVERLRQSVYRACLHEGRGLLADTPEKTSFTQHANILGILTGAIPQNDQPAVMEKLLSDKTLTPATFYFQFYLFEALLITGMGDRYLALLAPWRDMLARGLSTFAENPDPTRSDCHAWSASPSYHLLSLVAGIRPAIPGFKALYVAPHLGGLRRARGLMPHPLGDIRFDFERSGATGLSGSITLPEGLEGVLHWQGRVIPLRSGEQPLKF